MSVPLGKCWSRSCSVGCLVVRSESFHVLPSSVIRHQAMTSTIDPLLDQIKRVCGDEPARIIAEALLNRVSQAKPPDALLTRREAARYVNDELGHPLSFSSSTLERLT